MKDCPTKKGNQRISLISISAPVQNSLAESNDESFDFWFWIKKYQVPEV